MTSAPAPPASGTRVRAGNAMARTRAAVLAGAALSIAKHGCRQTTMADIAAESGIAKATLYNHFRRKADVYVALVEAEVDRIADDCARLAGTDLAAALTSAADAIAEHPVVRRLATDEPEVLAVLARAADPGVSPRLGTAAATVLSAAGREPTPEPVELVLRWTASHLLMPGTAQGRAAGAAILAASLRGAC